MAMNMEKISSLTKDEMKKKYASMVRAKDAIKARAEQIAVDTVGTLEVAAGASGTGLARGYFGDANGEINIPGTEQPIDGWGGLLLVTLGITGLTGKMSSHVLELGKGVGAEYLALESFSLGRKLRAERGKKK